MKRTNSLSIKTIAARSAAVLCFAAIYFAGIFFVFRTGTLAQKIQIEPVSNELVERAIRRECLYDSTFFRIASKRLEYTSHNPAVLAGALRLAVIKGPANAENLILYGEYAASRNDLIRARNLFAEAVRRFPTDAVITANAGLSLVNAGAEKDSLEFLARALSLDPALAYDIYAAMLARGINAERLVEVTPMKPEPIVALCGFLSSKGVAAADTVSVLIDRTNTLDLEPEQELRIARCAMKVHLFSLARIHADRLRSNSKLGSKVKTLLQEIDKLEKKGK